MSPTDLLAAVVLTYLVHSTVLLAAAYGLDRVLRHRLLALTQAFWRVALLGALASAALQAGLGWMPAAGSWSLGDAAASAPLTEPTELRPIVPAAPIDRAPVVAAPPLPWPALWLSGAALFALYFGFAHWRFRRAIAGRRDVQAPPVRERFDAVVTASGIRGGVRLTSDGRLTVPVAFGIRRFEICLPERCLVELTTDEQDSLFAHELAHLARRDPVWLLVDTLLCTALFFQPLTWLARRRLRVLSEMACDSWAVSALGRPEALAGCLAEVAGWTRRGAPPVLASAMAAPRSSLGRRIERLLNGSASGTDRLGHGPSWMLALGSAALVAFLAPGVSLADKESEKAKEPAQDEAIPPAAPELAPPDVPAPPPPPAPPRPKRRGLRALPPLPPVHPQPPMPQPELAGPSDLLDEEDIHRELELAGPDPAERRRIEQEARRLGERARAHAEHFRHEVESHRAEIENMRLHVHETVQRALEEARRHIEDAARQLERERRKLAEERVRLEQEKRALEQEKAQRRGDR